MHNKTLPKIIQGGMGVRISSWKLAREVSNRGELGVISSMAILDLRARNRSFVVCSDAKIVLANTPKSCNLLYTYIYLQERPWTLFLFAHCKTVSATVNLFNVSYRSILCFSKHISSHRETILSLISLGDPGGHFRRALASFPNQAMAQEALDKYFIPEGKAATKPYRSLPLWSLEPPRKLEEATILGSYCEIWLAKHNDDGR